MSERTDPIEEATTETTDLDLHDIVTWENRTALDGLAVALYRLTSTSARALIVLSGLVLFLAIGGFSAVTDPVIGALTLLSAIPAVGLAGYVYYSDVTTNEPVTLLVVTFLLSVLTASFAAVINTFAEQLFAGFGILGLLLFFFLIVGPVEEAVKLLAVRLYAYRDERFNAVVDGTVYGAMAGLGFAFIENALYITRGLDPMGNASGLALIGAGAGITATRALAGPGHVIYSAFAGYYLGLAKFNPGNRGPIVVKGLLIAALIHALYNSTVGIGAGLLQLTGLPPLLAFFGYVLVYDGLFAALLLRKINAYTRAYRRVQTEGPPTETAEAEFEY